MRRRTVVSALVFSLTLAACGPGPLDACTEFATLSDTREEVLEALDPATTTAEEAREFADALLDQLARFESAADGEYGSQIDSYRTAITDIQRLMADVEGEAVAEQWQSLLGDSLEVAAASFAQLEEAVLPVCES